MQKQVGAGNNLSTPQALKTREKVASLDRGLDLDPLPSPLRPKNAL